MLSFFKWARVKYENHLQEEKKRKIISEKESRKAVNNEEIKSVRNTTTRKEKEKVVLEKEAFNAMEKSVTSEAHMTKVFRQKGSCFETKLWWIKERNLGVGADITGTRNKISQIVNHCTI